MTVLFGLGLLLCCSTKLLAVNGENILGFYWGDDDDKVHKLAGVSHFVYDWNHATDAVYVDFVFGIITTIWTIVWLIYHTTREPHFKFEFHWLSRLSIRVHIASGCIEFILLYFAYFLDDSQAVKYIVYVICGIDVLHDLTALYQAPSTYGQKMLTFPAYVWVICFKFAVAMFLLVEPLSRNRLISLYCSHAQFTWLRLFYFAFMNLHLFMDSLYTVSMVIAVVLVQSLISGTNGVLLFLCYALICCAILRRCPAAYLPRFLAHGGLHERSRNAAHFASTEKLDMLVKQFHQFGDANKSGKARVLFEFIDVDESGTIEYNELSALFASCGTTLDGCSRIFAEMDVDANGTVELEEFMANRHLDVLVAQFEGDVEQLLKERLLTNESKALTKMMTIVSSNIIISSGETDEIAAGDDEYRLL